MKTVLIVDDNAANLKMVEDILSRDYRVVPVLSGRRALTFLERNVPDLILLDIEMPILNGIDTLKRIRVDIRTKNIPVMFLSARTDSGAVVEGARLGIVDYILKPFEEADVLRRVKAIIDV